VIVPADAISFVIESIGYALYAGNLFHKTVLLVGPEGNGKSKLLALVRSAVGTTNISSVPLQAFGETRFASTEVYGKLANICGDLDASAISRTDLFKQLTGGDPIMAERKFAHPFTYTSYALPMFSANEVPLTSDQSEAWFQRWLVIPMERIIRGTPLDDPHIEERILRTDELEGLLVRAVHGLRSLLDRGCFEILRALPTPMLLIGSASTACAASSKTVAWFTRTPGFRAPTLYRYYRACAPTKGTRPRTPHCSANGFRGST